MTNSGLSATPLLLAFLTLAPCSIRGDVIQGLYHAFWLTVPLPTDQVQLMLADGLTLVPPDLPGVPPGTHPVVLELGREYNSGPVGLALLQSDFFEFKMEVPWVNVSGSRGGAPFTSKLLIYVDSLRDSLGSRLLYGLDARRAPRMDMSPTAYVLGTSAGTLVANITGKGACGGVDDYPEFSWYQSVVGQRWFGRRPRLCADHHYDFASAKLCPVTATLTSDPSVLDPRFPSSPLSVKSIEFPLGAVEVLISFTITAPRCCR